MSTHLSVLQPHGQLVIHHGLKTLIVGLRVLLLALGINLLHRLLVRELAFNRDMARIYDENVPPC